MIRKSPQHDTENPPGQIVNPIKPSHLEKPLEQNIKDFLVDTEEMFTPEERATVGQPWLRTYDGKLK
jgi:hypothetical protein